MPFVPDSYDFVVPLRFEGTQRAYNQHAIDLIFSSDSEEPQLHVERARRSNSSEFVDHTLWKLGKPRPFPGGDKYTGLFTVPLTFEGDDLTKLLREEKCNDATERLLQFIKSQARLHLEVVADKKDASNLFINLDYRFRQPARAPKDAKSSERSA